MHLNFKIFIGLFLCTQLGWAQEKAKDTTAIKIIETFFEIAYTQPLFYGDNFINKGYDVNSTLDFGVTTDFYYKTTLHFDLNVTSADVVRPELIGNIRSANLTRVSFGMGYPLDIVDKLSFLPSLHVGYIKIGQKVEDGKFRDDGVFLQIEAALNYRLFEFFDISLGLKNHYDFIRIEAPSQVQSFFDNAQSVYPYLGVRFRVDK